MSAQPILSAEEVWREYDAVEARLTAPLSEQMLDIAQLLPGMRVLDLATGRGEPAIRAAKRVAPNGLVLGVDPGAGVLDMARAAAAREGVENLHLHVGNAEDLTELPAEYFHAATSRWGLMYMRAPVEALRHVRRALVQGAPLIAALWAEPERVPYFTLPRSLLPPGVAPPIDPEAPGTFRYADLARVERDFSAAGFTVVQQEALDVPVMEAADGAAIMRWCRAFGLTRLLNPLPAAQQEAWESAMIAAADGLRGADGLIRIGGVTRLVVAR